MATPLEPDDPQYVGPFEVRERLSASDAGVVFGAVDDLGRRVGVAVLTESAASDAAARDRFRAAILADPDILAAQPDGATPWVAARSDAERFLEPVRLGRARRRGPQFRPYWAAGSHRPATQRPDKDPGDGKGLAGSAIALAALLALLAVLVVLLFSCEPKVPSPPPDTPSPEPTTSGPAGTSPTPATPSPSGPIKIPSPSGTPDPTDPAMNPAAHPR